MAELQQCAYATQRALKLLAEHRFKPCRSYLFDLHDRILEDLCYTEHREFAEIAQNTVSQFLKEMKDAGK